jgi:hypothetical protein
MLCKRPYEEHQMSICSTLSICSETRVWSLPTFKHETASAWFVQQETQTRFLLSVSCSYKVGFDRDGIVNAHSNHQWAEIADTRNCSVLMSRQVLLICHIGLQAVTAEISSKTIYLLWGRTCFMHGVCSSISITEEGPLRGPRANSLDLYLLQHL